jgi:hypothetical protein
MRYGILTALLPLAACGPLSSSVVDNECHSASQKSYAGVVLVMSTGGATFATSNPHCVYFLDADRELYDRLFEAWRVSPYGDEVRPVYVDMEGEFNENGDPEKPQVFQVETVRSISINFTEDQAKQAFEVRMGPGWFERTNDRSKQPSERTRITD